MGRLVLALRFAALSASYGALAVGQERALTVEPLPDATAATAAEEPVATAAAADLPTATAPDTETPAPAATATDQSTGTPTATDTAVDTPTAAAATPTREATASDTAPPAPTRMPPATATATATPPWLARLRSGTTAASPAATAAAGGAALALLAAWAGARLAGGRERRHRRRARASLATALLLELRRIDLVLRRLVSLDNPAAAPPLDHPLIESALRDLTLFDPDTAARIVQLHSALRILQQELADYRVTPPTASARLGQLAATIRARAAAACRAIPALAKALERAGGTPPARHLLDAGSAVGEPSALPPSPFGAAEGDEWTL
ncbi:MAG: hypothetical protein AB7P78_12615 [Candidatus Binatia bacterium]